VGDLGACGLLLLLLLLQLLLLLLAPVSIGGPKGRIFWSWEAPDRRCGGALFYLTRLGVCVCVCDV
jgi:hypothetical protein